MKEKITRFARIMVTIKTEDGHMMTRETALLPHSSFTYADVATKKVIKTSRLFIPIKKTVRKKLELDVGEIVQISFSF